MKQKQQNVVGMRKFINYSAQIFQRLDKIDLKQIEYKIETDTKIDNVLFCKNGKNKLPFQRKQEYNKVTNDKQGYNISNFTSIHQSILLTPA